MSRLAGLSALAMVATVLTMPILGSPSSAAETKPNIILINLDDADYDLIGDPALDAYFPNIRVHLRDAGVRLTNLHVTTPLCGPSRVSLLRGQYAHNTGVLANSAESGYPGGLGVSYDNGYSSDDLSIWMQRSGYTTMLVDKYLHKDFPDASGDGTYVPPGWDEFYATLGGRYYDFLQLINGRRVRRASNYPAGFRTDIERNQALALLREHADDGPMFLYLAPFAPHFSVTPIYAERHAAMFPDAKVARTPDFDELDVSDKTPQYAALPPLGTTFTAAMDRQHRDRLRSMLAVDEMIGALVAELSSLGELDSTYIILTSDNGYQLGQHRVKGKKGPWDRSSRVGALVRGPGIPPRANADHLIGHIDLAPTILDMAGGTWPDWVDGISVLPILLDPLGTHLSSARDLLVIENWQAKTAFGIPLDTHYTAIRTQSTVYVEWANGDREYYDLTADPFQLDNRYDALPETTKQGLVITTATEAVCAGPECNRSEITNRPPNTTLDTPIDGRPTRSPLLIAGSASDDTGVAAVEVIVRSRQNSRYWNGVGFQVDFATVSATLDAPGTAFTNFGLTVTPPNIDLDVIARATDLDGTTDPLVDAALQQRIGDFFDPDTSLTTPTRGDTIIGDLTIAGTATDDVGVDHVFIVIKNTDDNTYWDGRWVTSSDVVYG